MYKLAYLIGFVPPLEQFRRRNAFITVLSAIGNDTSICESDMFRLVFRILRPYTLKPFEARQGFSLPPAPPAPPHPADALPRPRRFARLQRKLFGRPFRWSTPG
jgi:hypothetical protein